jgi:hypothetical protein
MNSLKFSTVNFQMNGNNFLGHRRLNGYRVKNIRICDFVKQSREQRKSYVFVHVKFV